MAAKLWPAVLGTTSVQFRKRLRTAKSLSPKVHLDVMDGVFVKTKSVGSRVIMTLSPQPGCQLHLMVKDPVAWYPVVKYLQASRVILHAEIDEKLAPAIRFYSAAGCTVDLALNPTTSLQTIQKYAKVIDGVVIMAVHPGKYGAEFQTKSLNRLRQVHQKWPRLRLTCDGGVNAQTIKGVVQAGATDIVVGSAVMLNRRPKSEWNRLKQLTTSR